MSSAPLKAARTTSAVDDGTAPRARRSKMISHERLPTRLGIVGHRVPHFTVTVTPPENGESWSSSFVMCAVLGMSYTTMPVRCCQG